VVIKTIVVGDLETNSYIFSADDQTCCIIDPGGQGEIIAQTVKDLKLHPQAILFTHGHLDHLLGTAALLSSLARSELYCPLYIHPAEMEFTGPGCLEAHSSMLYSLDPHMIAQYAPDISQIPKADYPLEEGMSVGDFGLEVLHTPGHSPGSVCFYYKQGGMLFSGDTLFYGSAGRTDLPGGSSADQKQSLKELISRIPDGTTVYPGHGPQTTISQEKQTNPFL